MHVRYCPCQKIDVVHSYRTNKNGLRVWCGNIPVWNLRSSSRWPPAAPRHDSSWTQLAAAHNMPFQNAVKAALWWSDGYDYQGLYGRANATPEPDVLHFNDADKPTSGKDMTSRHRYAHDTYVYMASIDHGKNALPDTGCVFVFGVLFMKWIRWM